MLNNMKRYSLYFAMVAPLVLATGCRHNVVTPASWEGGCFTVDGFTAPTPPAPHLDVGDQFCVSESGGKWWLEPGTGMSDWEAVGGGTPIEMSLVNTNPNNMSWTLNVDVDPHPPSTGHGKSHAGASWGFRLQVSNYDDPSSTDAMFSNGGGPKGETHGGSAHANLD